METHTRMITRCCKRRMHIQIINTWGKQMETNDEFGECECCGEHAKLHDGGLIVGGRDYGICRICDDCAISDDEYNALVAETNDKCTWGGYADRHEMEMGTGLYETVMAMRDACITNERAYRDDNIDAHLKRYITNRNARTGQTWRVVERYATNGECKRCAVDYEFAWYQRAIIVNEHGERARIWYRGHHWENNA